MSATKTGESTTSILKLMFFKINLHFVKSNQISTYRKLNLPLTSSIYFLFLPAEMQKRHEQTEVYYSFSHFVWKETTWKPWKVAAVRNSFVRYLYNLLRWMFFILWYNWKTLPFVKVYRYSETFEVPRCCFLSSQCLKEGRILCVISTKTKWC